MKRSKKMKRKMKKQILILLMFVAMLSVIAAVNKVYDIDLSQIIDNKLATTYSSDESISTISDDSNTSFSSDLSNVSNSNVADIISSMYGTVALYSDGTVKTWGTNTGGMLGNGNTTTTTVAYEPQQVIDSTNANLTDVKQISSYTTHTLALKQDGTVWGWGANGNGQIGNGKTVSTTAKAQQTLKSDGTELNNIIRVEAGSQFSLALDEEGKVWSWGYNSTGQLGNGTKTKSTKAVKVLTEDGEELKDIVDIQAGADFAIAITSSNEVYAWGNNASGQLGNGTTTFSLYAIKLDITDWKKISIQNQGISVLKNDGTIWTCGDNTYYQLGYETEDTYSITFNQVKISENEYLTNVEDFTMIAANGYAKINGSNYVYAWGDNSLGGLGRTLEDGSDKCYYPAPIENADETYFDKEILRLPRKSWDTILFIGADGIVYSAGRNAEGQRLTGDAVNREYVSIIGEVVDPIRVERIKVGDNLDLGITEDDLIKGINLYNIQLDTANFEYSLDDSNIATISSTGVVTAVGEGIAKGKVVDSVTGYELEIAIIVEETYAKVESAQYTTLALKEDGTVWAWGSRAYGLLGQGHSYSTSAVNSNKVTIPVQVQISASEYLTDIVQISAGLGTVMALDAEGNVWGWGQNNYGRLGIGNTTNYTRATKVYSGGDAVEIAVGNMNTAILLKNGSIYTAGNNKFGACSNLSTTSNVTTFTLAEKYEKNIKIDAGCNSLAALKIDETIWSTGGYIDNYYTESATQGNGSETYAKIPQKASIENVEDFTMGWGHIVAKTTSKELYTWGVYDASYDETTSTGTYEIYTLPVKVQGATNVDKIGSSTGTGYFTKQGENTIYSFGYNGEGELGANFDGQSSYLDIQEVEDADGIKLNEEIIKLSQGTGLHGTFIAQNGTIYGTGYNTTYQLGKNGSDIYNYATVVCGPEKIRVDRMLIGETLNLDLTTDDFVKGFNVFNLEEGTFTYEIYSEYQDIATVSSAGEVTAKAEGRAKGKVKDIVNGFEMDLVIDVEKNYTKVQELTYGNIALDKDGNVWSWGGDYYGSLGQGNTISATAKDYPTPAKVINESDETGYLTNIKDIAAADSTVLALDKDGKVWSWGHNDYGQLGTGDKTTYNKAQPVILSSGEQLSGIVKIANGYRTSMALSKDGTVYTWGCGLNGALANAQTIDTLAYATKTDLFEKAIEIWGTAYNETSVILKSTGTVWTSGYGITQLININAKEQFIPQKMNIENVKTLRTGGLIVSAIKEDGTVWTWGKYDIYLDSATIQETIEIGTPVQVKGITNATRLGGTYSAMAVMQENDNNIYTWGDNIWGEAGINDSINKVGNITTEEVSDLGILKTKSGTPIDGSKVDRLETANYQDTGFVIMNDGKVYGWGYNMDYSYLQKRDQEYYEYATVVGEEYLEVNRKQERIQIGETINITGEIESSFNLYGESVTIGTLTLKTENENVAKVEGTNVTGTGVGSTVITVKDPITEQEAIFKIDVINKNAITLPQVENINGFTVVLKEDGTVWTSGLNTYGQLGIGSTDNTYEQKQVLKEEYDADGNQIISELTDIVKISVSEEHVLALTKDGEVYGFGHNTYGQLGLNDETHRSYANKMLATDGVNYLNNIIDISAGEYLSVMLTKDGEVLTCGYSYNGQLGTGTTSDTVKQLVPTAISISNVIDIDVGIHTEATNGSTVIALTLDKKVYGWGVNSSGQLGTGNLTRVVTPTKIKEDIIQITVGGATTVLMDSEHKLYGAGHNGDGELGEKFTDLDYTTSFIEISNLVDPDYNSETENSYEIIPDTIQLGSWQLLVKTKEGKVYGTGWNGNGQLSQGNTTIESYYGLVPLKNKQGNDFENVLLLGRGGEFNTQLITKDGTVWITGSNDNGQFGNRTYDSSLYYTPFGIGYINLDIRQKTIKVGEALPVNLLESQPDFNVFTKEERFDFEWKSEDEDIATVSNSGVITGKSIGTTMITVTSKGTGIKSSLIINITTNTDSSIAMPQVIAGEMFTVVLKTDGTVWTTGDNGYGQLGNGTTTDRTYYDQVKISSNTYLTNVIKIGVGQYSCLALTKDGEVYAWGRNNYGQLGTANTTTYKYATKVKGAYNSGYLSDIIDISMGYYSSTALDKNGNVLTWGRNIAGELGTGNTTIYKYPVYSSVSNAISVQAGFLNTSILMDNGNLYQSGKFEYIGVEGATANVTTPTKILENVVQYSENLANGIAKTADGKIYTWGDNTYKQLMIGSEATYVNKPTEITLPEDKNGDEIEVKYVNTSDSTMLLDKNGYVYACGYNEYGALSNGTTENTTSLSIMLNSNNEPFENVLLLGEGKAYHTPLITNDGYIYTTGQNTYGEFGNETTESSNYLTIAGTAFLDKIGSKLIKMKTTETHTLNKSDFYTNGDFNVFSELNGATGSIKYEMENTEIATIDENGLITAIKEGTARVKVTESINNLTTYIIIKVSDENVQVKSGNYFSVALKANGTVWTWGYNHTGQLGINNKTKQTEPVQVLSTDGTGVLENIIDIGVGTYHVVALSEDGKVYTWGHNNYGQLGTGDTRAKYIPVEVEGLKDIVQVEAYGNTTYAIDKYGKVYVWGSGYTKAPELYQNIDEKILDANGNMLITESKYIYDLSTKSYYWGVNDVIQVVAGSNHYLALTAEGKVYAWGRNSYGQLGRGTTGSEIHSISEVLNSEGIAPVTDIVTISAGNQTSAAIDINGNVYTWGYNGNGQLGDETKVRKTLPVKIDYLSNIENISASLSYTMTVYDYDGYVYTTGRGSYGQLGNGSTSDKNKFEVIGYTYLDTKTNRIVLEEGGTQELDITLTNSFNLRKDVVDAENIDATILDDEKASLNGKTLTGLNVGKTLIIAEHSISNQIKYIELEVVKTKTKVAPKIESGNDFTISLKADGTVWSWGRNDAGQLGLGYYGYQDEPQKVEVKDPDTEAELEVTDISVGYNHVMALTSDGRVFTWGRGYEGQTGISSSNILKPTIVEWKTGYQFTEVVKVVAEEDTSYLIDCYGDVYSFGKDCTNEKYEAINPIEKTVDISNNYVLDNEGNVYNRETLEQIAIGKEIKSIEAGTDWTMFLSKDGDVYSIGSNGWGQLGNGTTTDSVDNVVLVKLDEETPLQNIIEIKGGDASAIAVDKYGNVYAWGINNNNKHGQEGYNYTSYAKQIPNVSNIMTISAGFNHTVVADDEGIVYSFGAGGNGQLGNRETNDYTEPVIVGDYIIRMDCNSVQVPVNGEKTIAGYVDNFNILYNKIDTINYTNKDSTLIKTSKTTLNSDNKYEITITGKKVGTTSIVAKQASGSNIGVVQVEVIPEGKTIKPQVSSGYSHTISLKANGTVWAWGDNSYGQLGTGDYNSVDDPVQVQFEDGLQITMISSAGDYSMALDSNGTVWTWGRSNYYQLGKSSTANVVEPTQITNLPKIIKIIAGDNSSVLLAEDGTLYTSGLNANGEAGNLEYRNKVVLEKAVDMKNVIDISAGAGHVMALKSDGTVWVTGSNLYGQLANNDTSIKKVNKYQKVEISETISYIEAGQNSCHAITVDGKVWSWGSNIYGELGTGDKENTYTPIKNTTLTNIREISSGVTQTIARDGYGYAYVVGTNKQGELGDGTTANKTKFAKLDTINNVMDITTGETYTVIALTDGTVWAWGDYNHGDETKKSKTNSEIPVKIGSDNISLEKTEVTLKIDETKKIEANGEYEFNLIYEVEKSTNFTFTSLNTEVVQVDSEGNMVGIREGTTWIKVHDVDNDKDLVAIVKVIDSTKTVAPRVKAGENFAVGLKSDGSMWTWGYNGQGQLATGSLETEKVPTQTNVIQSYTNISVGKDFALALRADGTVWGYGSNTKSQIATANLSYSTKPIQINGLTNIEQIAAGDAFGLALDNYGALYGWGENSKGQLGSSNIGKYTNTPVRVLVSTDRIMQIAAGENQSVIVDSSGRVYGFGEMLNGFIDGINNAVKAEVGNGYILILTTEGKVLKYYKAQIVDDEGNITYQYKTTEVSINSDVIDISVQNNTNMYQTISEKAYVWGNNDTGALGTGTTSDVGTPVQAIENGDNVYGIGAGYNNTYIIANTGYVYAAGDSTYGQLGNGSNDQSLVHTLVGDRAFEVLPETAVMHIGDTEELDIQAKVFNVLKDVEKKVEEYTITSDNETSVSVLDGVLNANDIGTANITIKDNQTEEEIEIVRVVNPIDQDRISKITVNDVVAEVVDQYNYKAIVGTDDITADLEVITNDSTDEISIDGGTTWYSDGTLTDVVDIPTDETVVEIQVKASNGEIVKYNLTIIKQSVNNKLLELKVNGTDAIKVNDKKYEILVDDIDSCEIFAKAESAEALVSIDGTEYEVNNKTITDKQLEEDTTVVPIIIKSEYGNTEEYTLYIYKNPKIIEELESITVNGELAKKLSETKYYAIIEDDANIANIIAQAKYSQSQVAIEDSEYKLYTNEYDKTITEQETTIKIYIKDTNDEIKEYELEIVKKSIAEQILKLEFVKVNGEDAILSDTEDNVYEIELTEPLATAQVVSQAVLDDANVKIEVGDYKLKTSTEDIEITSSYVEVPIFVQREEIVSKYTLKIYGLPEETGLEQVKVNGETATYNTASGKYQISVLSSVEDYYIEAIAKDSLANVKIQDYDYEIGIAKQIVDKTEGETITEVIINCKAQNGITEKQYILEIRQKSSDAEIVDVFVNNEKATYTDEGIYYIEVSGNTEKGIVKVTTSDTNATVAIQSVNENPYTVDITETQTIVNIVVTAEDGTENTKQLKIKRLSNDTSITSVKVGEAEDSLLEATIDDDGNYYYKINRVDNCFVEVALNSNTSKVSIDGNEPVLEKDIQQVTLNDEITTVKIEVEAEDGTTEEKTLTIEKISNDNTIKEITGEYIISSSVIGENTYEIKVDDNIGENLDIDIVTTNKNAQIKLETDTDYEINKITRTIKLEDCIGTDEDGNEIISFKVNVKAENGDEATYTIIVTKIHTLDIQEVKVNDITATENGENYDVVIPRTTDEKIEITTKNADVKISLYEEGLLIGEDIGILEVNTTLVDENKTYVIVVTDPEDELRTKVYKLNVRKQSIDNTLLSVKVDNVDVPIVDGIYTIDVKSKDSDYILDIVANDSNAKIKINEDTFGTNISSTSYSLNIGDIEEIDVTVQAENGDEQTYKVKIHVLDNSTQISSVTVDGIEVKNYDSNTKTYRIEVDNTKTLSDIYVKASSEKAIVKLDSNTNNTYEMTNSKDLLGAGNTTITEILVIAEDGTEETRYLEIVQLSNSIKLDNITVNDILAEQHDDGEYYVEIGDSTGKANIIVTALDSSSTVIIDDDEVNAEIGTKTEIRDVKDNDNITVKITVRAEDGNEQTYYLHINVVSSNAELDQVKVNNIDADLIADNTYRYFIDSADEEADIYIATQNEEAEIATNDDNTGIGELEYTKTNITDEVTEIKFTVKAEDGTTKENTLYIYKISTDATLKNLWVDDVLITSEDGKNYRAKVADTTEEVKVKAETTNEFATVRIGYGLAYTHISEEEITLEATKETTVTIEVTSQSGKIETINLVIEKISSDVNIETILVNAKEAVYNSSLDKYYAIVERDKTSHEVFIMAENNQANIEFNEENDKGALTSVVTLEDDEDSKEMEIKVTAEDGINVITKTLVIVKSSDNVGVGLVQVNDETLTPTNEKGTEYMKIIPDDMVSVKVRVKTSDPYASIKLGDEDVEQGEIVVNVSISLDQMETTIPVVVTATDGTTIETYNIILRRESYKPETGIQGKIYTENIDSIYNATITVYKSSEETLDKELVIESTTNEDGTYKVLVYKAPINKSSITDENKNGVADALEQKYDVVISKQGYLSYTIKEITLTEGEYLDLGEYTLIAGDVVETGEIEIDDLVSLNDNYGEIITDDNKETKAIFDLNEDGVVDKLDRNILKKNYSKKAETVTWVDPNAVNQIALMSLYAEEVSTTSTTSVTNSTSEISETNFIVPMTCSYTITSEYGYRVHPTTGEYKKHTGIDLAGTWHTEILAVADGEVTFAGVQSGFGNCVEIKHVVDGKIVYSFYAHLSRIDVEVGDIVKQGEVIGLEGGDPESDPNPGSSTGHHLHFEIRSASGYGNDVDPNDYIEF